MYDNMAFVQEEAYPLLQFPYYDCKITWSTSTLLVMA